MLTNHTPNHESIWNRLQEPARPSHQPGDYLLLLSALDNGWTILDAQGVFSWGRQGREHYYLLHLMNTTHLQTCELTVRRNPQVEDLLETHQVPIAAPPPAHRL